MLTISRVERRKSVVCIRLKMANCGATFDKRIQFNALKDDKNQSIIHLLIIRVLVTNYGRPVYLENWQILSLLELFLGTW